LFCILVFRSRGTQKSYFVPILFKLAADSLATRAPAIHSKTLGNQGMKKTLCAGVCALAMIGLLPNISAATASERAAYGAEQGMASIDVGRIKSVLHLTSQQERYWPPVESALRDIARRQASAEPAGLVRRISRRVVSLVLDSAAIRRLAVAARPLIGVLDDQQKQSALGMAHQMGLGPVLAALN
jgi:hypothetical protein